MKLKNIILATAITIILFAPVSHAREISGVNIAESATVAETPLVLNGAGIRSKFFFSIYIGSLYITEKTTKPELVFANDKAKKVVMNMLYKELAAKKITDGWIDGFKNNNNQETYGTLEQRLKTFNSFFTSSKKGDVIELDYKPDEGTSVIINNELKGTVPGQDFNTALLKVWLGDSPADSNLKEAMLGDE